MAKNKDTRSSPAPKGEGGMLTNLISLTLPVLSFQRDMLSIIRTGLERDKEARIKAVEKFLSFQLHALMMTFDPAQKLRGRFDDKLENELKVELTQILEKVTSGLVGFVEIQQTILPRVIEILQKMKNGKQTGTGQA